jgi:Putative Flp pilus-assembly TadE/G-like
MTRSSIANQLRRLRADQRGAVSIMMGFLMIPLVGFLALGFEVSNWYMITRSMQNAADASTLAAAINNGANYDVEARAVAARYGFVNGTNNITIAVTNTAACPSGGNNCYSVSILGYTPLLLSQVVGFQGAGNVNGALQKQLNAVAMAQSASQPQPVCLLALASSGAAQGIRTNGAPTGNMNGCDSMSNTAAQCNGSNLGLGVSFAVGSNNGCGASQVHNDAMADPYLSFANNIPTLSSSGCAGNYPQETHHGNASSGGTARTGQITLPAGNTFWCGDQLLTGDVTINTPASGAVLIIENGQLDLNGHTFRTSSGSALTLVFSGSNGGYTHAPTDNTNGSGGVLDIAAPNTGVWSGVAIYQDPNLTSGVDVSAAGNSPTWNITGLIYMPHASVTLKGAIDKSNFGNSCVVMVADNFQISGNGGIAKTDTGHCPEAGLNMPTAKIPGGAKLVL